MNKELEFLKIINNTLDDNSYLGDDCAYLEEYNLAISSDVLVEDVHFKKEFMSYYEIAQKALLVNISDILASGSTPQYATINLSGKLDEEFIEEFYKGINDISRTYNIKIIGGDLTKADKLVVGITIFGSYKNKNISKRNNAKPGYIIAAIGEFGSSAKGLEELLKNNTNSSYYINYHKKPTLYPQISKKIATLCEFPYAMMDSSDGLVDCLSQIAKKSKVRIEINYDNIPHKTKNKDFVLYGGEDYSLVVCLDKKDYKKFPELVKIGECSIGEGVFIDNKEIKYKSFEHFN